MEGYSTILPSSTNSDSSPSTNNIPFSLIHMPPHDSNGYDLLCDHHDQGISNQNEPLISGMMGKHQDYERSILKVPMVEFHSGYNDNYHGDHDDDYQRKGFIMANNSKGNNKIRSSSEKVKKHRYAFQTRSQVDILDDGYRWRKYGQKAVKNNNFPRSYYRCTHQGCNVKKQVQRLSKDEGVVVTTYEGIHSHPVDKSTDNFDHILSQMQIYTPF